MKIRRWILSFICLILAVVQLATPITAAEEEASHNEALVLDEMAQSWIDTCTRNIEACKDGLDLYALGQPTEWHKEAVKKQFFDDILNGYKGSTAIQCNVDVDALNEALGGNTSLKADIHTYFSTNPDSEDPDERKLHTAAQSSIYAYVNKGEIADDVKLSDVIKENYSFFVGMIMCESAIESFEAALASTDLTAKRTHMLLGAFVGTIGCGMSVEDADAVIKNPDKTPQELMVEIAETGMDMVSDIAPQIGIAYETIKLTAEVGIKVLGMSGKLDALAGYIESPHTIQEDYCAYYNALSNQYGLYTYEISDYEVIMDEYNGFLLTKAEYQILDIPQALYTFPVTEFAGCFVKDADITEITIPSTIRSRALSHVVDNCDSLQKVYYNATNCKGWYLGYFFYDCDSHFDVIFGNGVTVIPERFIGSCGVKAVTFPEGITTIHAGALVNCPQLAWVSIPSTLTEFVIDYGGQSVIKNCPKLQTAIYKPVDVKNGYFGAIFEYCGNDAEEMVLIIDEDVTATPATFLKDCGVKEVTFPEGITLIREYAISQCTRLETITVPSTVTQFGDASVTDSVFSKCDSLKTVNYHAKNSVGEVRKVFKDIQSDFSLVFGEGIVEIPPNFISNCGISTVTFPEGLETIGSCCLVACNALTTVTVPSTVSSIGYHLVADCANIDTIYFNANCLKSGSTALIRNNGNLNDPKMRVILGENVTTVPENFIENCGITEFTYPQSVTAIHSDSLVGCTALKTVRIPASVTGIGCNIVSNCPSLTDLYYSPGNVQRLADASYLFNACGNTYGMRLHLAQDITALPKNFMVRCGVESVTIPDGVALIPEQAFTGCARLNSVTVGSKTTKIGTKAFQDCSALTALSLGNVTEIGTQTFSGCTGLTELLIPHSMQVISASAFYNCTGLTSVTYCGTPVDWCAVKINSGNSCLTNAHRAYHLWNASAGTAPRICSVCGGAETNYWILRVDSEISYSMTSDLYIDLKGFDLSGTLITNGYKIYGMDSVTDGYTRTGMGRFSCVDENDEAVVPEAQVRTDISGSVKRYLSILDNYGYSFHRFYLGITTVSLRPGDTGFGYKAVFYGDDMVIAQLDADNAFGFTLQLDDNTPLSVYKTRKSFVSGKTVTLRLSNYDVLRYGEAPLAARVMLRLSDGTIIESSQCTMTMRSMLETLNGMKLTASQLAAVKAMIEKYPIIKAWNTKNLYT